MKKTAFALAFLLVLGSFTGCTMMSDKEESVIVIDDDLFINSEQVTDDIESGDAETEESKEKKKSSEKKEEPTEETTEAESDGATGVVSGDFYKNEYFGIKLSSPFGWKMIKGKVAKAFVEITAGDLVKDDDSEDKQTESAFTVDALCMNSYYSRNYAIMQVLDLSKLSSSLINLTEDEYLAAASYDEDMNNLISDLETVSLGGKEFRRVAFSSYYDGASSVIAYYARKEGEFIMVITIEDNTLDEVIAMEKSFSALN